MTAGSQRHASVCTVGWLAGIGRGCRDGLVKLLLILRHSRTAILTKRHKSWTLNLEPQMYEKLFQLAFPHPCPAEEAESGAS